MSWKSARFEGEHSYENFLAVIMQEAETQTVLQVQTLPTLASSPEVVSRGIEQPGRSTGSALPPGSPPALPQRLRYSVPPPRCAAAPPRRRAAAPPRSPPDAPDALSARRAHHANPWFRIITQAIRAFKVGGGNWACGLQFAVLGSQLPGDSGPTRYDLPQSCNNLGCDSVEKIRIKGQAS